MRVLDCYDVFWALIVMMRRDRNCKNKDFKGWEKALNNLGLEFYKFKVIKEFKERMKLDLVALKH